MKPNIAKSFSRFLSAFLIVALCLPTPAHALRPHLSPEVRAGIEEDLRGEGAEEQEKSVLAELTGTIHQPAPDSFLGTVAFADKLTEGEKKGDIQERWLSLDLHLTRLELGFHEPLIIPLPGVIKDVENRANLGWEIINMKPAAPGNESLAKLLQWALGLKRLHEMARLFQIFEAVNSVFGRIEGPEDLDQGLSWKMIAEAAGRPVDNVKEFKEPGDLVRRMRKLTRQYRQTEVPIGLFIQEGCGVCRHRALLFRELGRAAGLNVTVRIGRPVVGLGRHAWNEVILKDPGTKVFVDVMNPAISRVSGAKEMLLQETMPGIKPPAGQVDVSLSLLPEQEGFGLVLKPVAGNTGFKGPANLTVMVNATALDPVVLGAVLGKKFQVRGEKLVEEKAVKQVAPAPTPSVPSMPDREQLRRRWPWIAAATLLVGTLSLTGLSLWLGPREAGQPQLAPVKAPHVLDLKAATVTPTTLTVELPPSLAGKWIRDYLRTDEYYPQSPARLIPPSGIVQFVVPIRLPNRPGWVEARGRAIAVFDDQESANHPEAIIGILRAIRNARLIVEFDQEGVPRIIRAHAGAEEKAVENLEEGDVVRLKDSGREGVIYGTPIFEEEKVREKRIIVAFGADGTIFSLAQAQQKLEFVRSKNEVLRQPGRFSVKAIPGSESGTLIKLVGEIRTSGDPEQTLDDLSLMYKQITLEFQALASARRIPLEISELDDELVIRLIPKNRQTPDKRPPLIDLGEVLANAGDAILDRAEVERTWNTGRIELSVRQEEDSLVLEVSDNGVGINKTGLGKKVFREQFTTKQGKARRGKEGAGLVEFYGLKLVEESGGILELVSRRIGGRSKAWRLTYNPSHENRYALMPANRPGSGTTVSWRFPRIFSAGAEEMRSFPNEDLGRTITEKLAGLIDAARPLPTEIEITLVNESNNDDAPEPATLLWPRGKLELSRLDLWVREIQDELEKIQIPIVVAGPRVPRSWSVRVEPQPFSPSSPGRLVVWFRLKPADETGKLVTAGAEEKLPADGMVFDGLTAAGGKEIILAPDVLPDDVVLGGLQAGEKRLVVQPGPLDIGGRIYVGWGVELSPETRKVLREAIGEERIIFLPQDPESSHMLLVAQGAGAEDLALLSVSTSDERRFVPPHVPLINAPTFLWRELSASQLAGLEEVARLNGGSVHLREKLRPTWKEPMDVYDLAA